MTIDVDAVYEDGVLKPERPLPLKRQARVRVTIDARAEKTPGAADPTGGKAIDPLIARIEVTPPGAAIGREHGTHLCK